MKLKIEVYAADAWNSGKTSKNTYEKQWKRKHFAGNSFIMQSSGKPGITISVMDDPSLEDDVLYLSKQAKDIYFPTVNEIESDDLKEPSCP